jgi:putative transposase
VDVLHLYAILDVFSRYVVGWSVQHRETGPIAEALIAQAIEQQQIARGQLTVHADRGAPMRSKPVAFLLADLGVTKTHSRPYTSTDNPYSEAHFKTLKYGLAFPARFDSIEQAREFCRESFGWYNNEHRHSGISLITPASVHYDAPRKCTPTDSASSPQPTRRRPSGSSAGHRQRHRSRPPRGST